MEMEIGKIGKSPCSSCETGNCYKSGHGCSDWMEWFVLNWNENIHRDVDPALIRRRFAWKYPHPHEVGR